MTSRAPWIAAPIAAIGLCAAAAWTHSSAAAAWNNSSAAPAAPTTSFRAPPGAAPETLVFTPSGGDSAAGFARGEAWPEDEDRWMRAPFGEGLITERERWRPRQGLRRVRLLLDYNRVDRLRLGLGDEFQVADRMAPRVGARLEYAFGRERLLYGLQIEQPLIPPGRIALGVSAVRRTDHLELQQIGDGENTLAMLLGRYDYRDYFEREGMGAYLAWRVPDFSTVSLHLRTDDFRTLPLDAGTPSLFHRSRTLRDNPPVDEGQAHTVSLRLERAAHTTQHVRSGLYHWVELEWAGHGLGGDFEYVRALADLRSVFRLSPATTLILRLVGGHTASGVLPAQRSFPVGGVDGLRAHDFDEYRGDQMALAQAEYSLGLWRFRRRSFESGLDALVFVDTGRAWSQPRDRWDIARQQMEADGGFGISTADDNLRVYVARSLQQAHAAARISVRLHRPF